MSLLLPGGDAPVAATGPQVPAVQTPAPAGAPGIAQQNQAELLYARGWEQPIDSSDGMTVAVGARSVYLGGKSLAVSARNLSDGLQLWTSPLKPAAPIVVGDGLVFVLSDDRLTALDETTGAARWSSPAVPSPGPVLHGGIILLPTATGLQARRAADGSETWKQDLGGAPVTRPAVHASTVYIALGDKTLVALELGSGAIRWRTPQELQPTTLLASDGLIAMGTAESFLCAARQVTGVMSWCFPSLDGPEMVRAAIAGDPVRQGKKLYVALVDNTLRTFSAGSGALLQREPLPARPASDPRQVGPWLIVPLSSGQFVLFSIATGKEIASLAPPREIATLQAAAIAADGSVLVSVTVSPGDLRVLATYFKK
ncbi:MAG TPA: PQQ-binding-like beta-propeller repeat protein [Vicinamibacterales bacterium]|nr:PQQ-binding-like beta-propeller repeat protein [Vicinamibacterales bacterium]